MWDFYLQDRTSSSIITVLRSFLGILNNQYRIRPQVIECDNEIYKTKTEVRVFVESRDIRLEPSPPRTQELNGAAERSGGVVKEKARAMRSGSKLPAALWREISRAAVYLLNRTPRYQYSWKTPYDLFHGQKPSQAHLRAYGCKAFAMTPDAQIKQNRLQRLNPKAWIGYLVGYDSTNVYRVWNPVTNKVVRTRDVTFNEEAVFDGNLESLKDDMLKISLDELSELLGSYTLPEDQEEESPVQPAQEEPDEVRELVLDEIIVATDYGRTDQNENPLATTDHSRAGMEEPKQWTEEDGVYPTPPLSPPPVALLAATIREIYDHKLLTSRQEDPDQCAGVPLESWKAVFLAGPQVGTAGKVGNRRISRVQYQRLLQKPLALCRKDLPELPRKHSELENHPLGQLFVQAEKDHLQSHQQMRSWREISSKDLRLRANKALDCKWVYVYKFDKHGRFLKTKARLVVRGDQQPKSLSEDTYAATLAGRSFRTLMAISARFDLELIQYDAVNAFVNADLTEEIFMKMPAGYRKPGTVLQLQKALYGLRKSPLL